MRHRSRTGKKRNLWSILSRQPNLTWRQRRNANRGFSLVVVVFIGIMLIGLLTAYMLLSKVENTSATASNDSSAGFYAAESGLNLRAATVLARFTNRGQPTGTSPTSIAACTDTTSGNNGTGDFACINYDLSQSKDGVPRTAATYMVDTTQYIGSGVNRTPIFKTIPPDEPFAGLNAQENSYQLNSVGRKMTTPAPQTEAILTMDLKSRVVPMFQFAAFYNGDLEILPSPVMTLAGPVHTNGDLYLGAGNTLTLQGQVTVAGTRDSNNNVTGGMFNSRKNDSSTYPEGRVRINNSTSSPVNLLSGATGATTPLSTRLNTTTNMPIINASWGSRVVIPAPQLQMPPAGLLSTSGEFYCNAEIRVDYTPSLSTTASTVLQSVPMAISKVDQTTRTPPCSTGNPSTNGATTTSLNEGQLRSLLQPVLGATAVSTAKGTIAADPSSGAPTSFPTLTSTQKPILVRTLQLATLAQATPVTFGQLSSAISSATSLDSTFSGSSSTYSSTGTNLLDSLLATDTNFSSWSDAQKSALKGWLRGLTPAQIAAFSIVDTNGIEVGRRAWFPAAFMDVGGLNPTTYYNDREGRDMRLLQLNLASLTIWNKDGVYLNYASGAVSDSASNQLTYITNGTIPSANQLLFTLAAADSGAPTGSFQRLGYAGTDITDGGYVMHMTINGTTYTAAAGNTSPYGFVLSRGSDLFGLATTTTTPDPTGVTFASDQAIYIQGDLNSINKQPASTLSDSLNVLSNACTTADARIRKTSGVNCNSAVTGSTKATATNTTINAAFLAGTDVTNSSLTSGYNGGLENYPRFNENWSGQTLTYRGSFVSLGIPQKVRGNWGSQAYNPPARNWGYELAFNGTNNLPPLDPRFVYLKQATFVRSFEQQ